MTVSRISGMKLAYQAATAFFLLGCATGLAKDKILLGSHIGDATIVSIAGINSNKAIVRFRRELDDYVEDCVRNIGPDENGSINSEKVAECVDQQAHEDSGHINTRRANCSHYTLYTEFGNFSMVNYEKEPETEIEGKPYRPIRTDWKDHRTEEIVGNCSACGTPQMLDTLRILCPAWYSKIFEGFDPY
jgi:hypothetical protein